MVKHHKDLESHLRQHVWHTIVLSSYHRTVLLLPDVCEERKNISTFVTVFVKTVLIGTFSNTRYTDFKY